MRCVNPLNCTGIIRVFRPILLLFNEFHGPQVTQGIVRSNLVVLSQSSFDFLPRIPYVLI